LRSIAWEGRFLVIAFNLEVQACRSRIHILAHRVGKMGVSAISAWRFLGACAATR